VYVHFVKDNYAQCNLVEHPVFRYSVIMAYEVTATRRRPQRFDDLAGQEFVAATLKNAIQSGQIAHAYLFSGPRGCGKTSTARILAKALNCSDGPTAQPCGVCTRCIEITKGSCTDVIEIDGASNTSVNDIRQIKDEILFPPQSCRYKIYIIDEVHMLSTSAFNALLKTIEEPPPYVIFIFATTELQKVPATIKSRCQQFNFRLVAPDQIKELLRAAAGEAGITVEDEALNWIARESTGSIRDAYTLFDQVAAFSGDGITYEKIRDKLGLFGIDRLNDLFSSCCAHAPAEVLTKIDGLLQSGSSLEQLIANSVDYLRSLLFIKSGITSESILGQPPDRYNENVVSAWNTMQIERALSLFFQLYRDIRYSLNPRYELELVFSRLCWLDQYASPAEVKTAVDRARQLLAGAAGTPGTPGMQTVPASMPAATPAAVRQSSVPVFRALSAEQDQPPPPRPFESGGAVPPEQAAAPAVPADTGSDLRTRAIAGLTANDALLAASLMQTGTWERNGDTITAPIESAFQQIQLESQSARLSEYLTKLSGQKTIFHVVGKSSSAAKNADTNAPPPVQLLCRIFKGSITGCTPVAAANEQEQPEPETEQPAPDMSETTEQYETPPEENSDESV
jgi:DNA polymerase III subunit gamma/tau